jgi:hypothetical protein
MRSFEERYTAWLDGTLTGPEREEFEAALPDRDAAARDAADWSSLRGLLREVVEPQPMPHGDFANAQVLAAIRGEAKREPRAVFPVLRLVWAGAFLLALGAGVSLLVVPHVRRGPSHDQFISQVVRERAGNPNLGASAFVAPGGKGAVLWVDDAGYIPPEEKIK